jgi:hypothetical protein
MKKLISILLGFVLLSSMVFAQQGIHEPGTGIEDPELRQARMLGQGMNGTPEPTLYMGGEGMMARLRAETPEELRQMIQERRQEMAQEMQRMTDKTKEKVYQNQNRVREAVHSFLAMEDLVGGIGPQVREIARNFNNSVQATIKAEERVQKRNALQRFFAGGDNEAAEEIEGKVKENQERIQQLKQLREECECGSEVKALMQEQIQNMEQEQTRLQELAQKEKASKGMFGWLWK